MAVDIIGTVEEAREARPQQAFRRSNSQGCRLDCDPIDMIDQYIAALVTAFRRGGKPAFQNLECCGRIGP